MPARALDVAQPHQDRSRRSVVFAPGSARPLGAMTVDVEQATLLRLQQLHGNRHVQRLIRDHTARSALPIQCKLLIGAPGDDYEREAETIAATAVGPAATVAQIRQRVADQASREAPVPPQVARKAPGGGSCPSAPSEEEAAQARANAGPGGAGAGVEEEQGVMAKAFGPTLTSFAGLEQRLAQRRGGGSALPKATRLDLETRLGHDFRDVRVHTDGEAADLARSLAAEAFTSGADLYFAAGRFDPQSTAGRRLLAHELVHVVQQRQEAHAIDRTTLIQRYGLIGFPAAEKARMEAAIPLAKSGMMSCDLDWKDFLPWGITPTERLAIYLTLGTITYVYDPDLGLCGWTFPTSPIIKIGKEAFGSTCCDLHSTLAHEASHVNFYTEGGARKLEKKCFGC